MEDISFWGNNAGSGGGSGTANYNELLNKPVQNISGAPVILSTLATGIYNIGGTWAMLAGSEVFDTPDDDLFYILNEGGECKTTRVSSDGVYIITLPTGGSTGDIIYDTVATVEEAVGEVMGRLWGTF